MATIEYYQALFKMAKENGDDNLAADLIAKSYALMKKKDHHSTKSPKAVKSPRKSAPKTPKVLKSSLKAPKTIKKAPKSATLQKNKAKKEKVKDQILLDDNRDKSVYSITLKKNNSSLKLNAKNFRNGRNYSVDQKAFIPSKHHSQSDDEVKIGIIKKFWPWTQEISMTNSSNGKTKVYSLLKFAHSNFRRRVSSSENEKPKKKEKVHLKPKKLEFQIDPQELEDEQMEIDEENEIESEIESEIEIETDADEDETETEIDDNDDNDDYDGFGDCENCSLCGVGDDSTIPCRLHKNSCPTKFSCDVTDCDQNCPICKYCSCKKHGHHEYKKYCC